MPILAMATLYGCSFSDVTHNEGAGGEIIPALRYVEYENGNRRYEDISEGDPEIADDIKNTPVAQGAMGVNCASVREIGLLFRYRYTNNIAGYRHDYDYDLWWPDSAGREPEHFTYERRLRGWYRRGAARFLEPLTDGLVALSVTHRDEKIYTTEFNIVGCP
ncbi:MAG: hypothetical protein OER91_14315 [Gammaproteobacteria bacterium]|nr:hypothetical protein [Gammaproteobacteria bacterium]